MDDQAAVAALRVIRSGIDDLILALNEQEAEERSKEEREADLALEFDRADGQGLRQSEASLACKRHGFAPQTVGAWARGGWIETRSGRRYLTPDGYKWMAKVGRQTQHGPAAVR